MTISVFNAPTKMVYISVQYPGGMITQFDKVKTFVHDDSTEVKEAKTLRKAASRWNTFEPSKYAWAIFDGVDDEIPRLTSDNWVVKHPQPYVTSDETFASLHRAVENLGSCYDEEDEYLISPEDFELWK